MPRIEPRSKVMNLFDLILNHLGCRILLCKTNNNKKY